MRVIAVLAFSCFIAGCGGASPATSEAQAAAATVPPPRVQAGATIDASRRTAITSAAERVAPAVVTVQVETRSVAPADVFDILYGARERVQASMGSGFIVRSDGVVVTNAHVVAGATTVSVAMRDGKTFQARVIGADQLNDVAVLRIDARDMPVAPLGNSSDVIVGEWAIAIGNPFGFVLANAEPSVTAGVVSGTGRNLLARSSGQTGTYDMIQTDAAINPGNSGGPLVNALGEVIGMNTVIYTPSQGSVGLGFAVPINRVKRITEELLANGAVRRPWIGVKLREPSGNNPREALATGAIVSSVIQGSPAAQAGIRAGDEIIQAGDTPVRNYFGWESVRLDLRVGEQIPVRLRRGSAELTVNIRVANEPEVSAPKLQVLKELQLAPLTPAIRGERGIISQSGAVVTEITAGLAGSWNLQRGDVIIRVYNIDIGSPQDVADAFEALAGRGPFYVYFERGGRQWRTIAQIRQG
jgi:serine protease Do